MGGPGAEEGGVEVQEGGLGRGGCGGCASGEDGGFEWFEVFAL